jgi:formylglycine-generating enzyme required for sulfatase activity
MLACAVAAVWLAAACVDIVGVGELPDAADARAEARPFDTGAEVVAEAAAETGTDAGTDALGCEGQCTPGEQRCYETFYVETCTYACTWQTPSEAYQCRGMAGCQDASCVGGSGGDLNPSCAGDTGICGPKAFGEHGCCRSEDVPTGTYYRTYVAGDAGLLGEAGAIATVGGFQLDDFEVTVNRFRNYASYLNDGGALPAEGTGKHAQLNAGLGLASTTPGVYESGWQTSWNDNVQVSQVSTCGAASTWTPAPGGNENLPINCINWYTSYAFCIWDGGFLPSVAEWEYAAAGGSQQLEYPWGTTPPGSGNHYAIYNCNYKTDASCTPAPVGFADAGADPWGHWDLLGNLAEWNLDFASAFTEPCVNCASVGSTSTLDRSHRGGGYTNILNGIFTWTPAEALPSTPDARIGVRCAREP